MTDGTDKTLRAYRCHAPGFPESILWAWSPAVARVACAELLGVDPPDMVECTEFEAPFTDDELKAAGWTVLAATRHPGAGG